MIRYVIIERPHRTCFLLLSAILVKRGCTYLYNWYEFYALLFMSYCVHEDRIMVSNCSEHFFKCRVGDTMLPRFNARHMFQKQNLTQLIVETGVSCETTALQMENALLYLRWQITVWVNVQMLLLAISRLCAPYIMVGLNPGMKITIFCTILLRKLDNPYLLLVSPMTI